MKHHVYRQKCDPKGSHFLTPPKCSRRSPLEAQGLGPRAPLWGLRGSARELPSEGSGARPKSPVDVIIFAVKQEPTDGGVVVPVAVVWCGDGGGGGGVVVTVVT